MFAVATPVKTREAVEAVPGAKARGRLRGDRGEVTLEHIVIFPVLLLFFFAAVQGGVYWHGRNTALAAAEAGVREGRVAGSAQVGIDAAQDYLDQVANQTFSNVGISSAGSTADDVQVTVTATVPSLFPGLWDLEISQVASGPIEQTR